MLFTFSVYSGVSMGYSLAGEKLEKMSSRFLVIVWVFVVLILTASYSANLTSTKTVSRFQLDGLLTNYASLRSTTTRLITSEDYAQALLNGTISFVVDEIPYLSVFVGHYPGVFNMIDTASNSNGFGFVCASPNLVNICLFSLILVSSYFVIV